MSTAAPILIECSNLSHAWGLTFLKSMSWTKREIRPLLVTIGSFDPPLPREDLVIRNALDRALGALGKCRCDVSALMIFPYKIWVRRGMMGCGDFSGLCIHKLLPRLKKLDRRNRYGTYFGRMMDYEGARTGSTRSVNQLQVTIDLLRKHRRRPRHSALQVACFDPAKDHTGQAVRGFPCLQQVSFGYDDDGGLAVTGYYPMQYIFDRAYGNYLGLCHLGAFMAKETGMTFRRMSCFVGRPELGGVTKHKLRELEIIVRGRLSNNE